MPASHLIRFGDFELDLGRYELRRAGLRVRLEKQPFELLILLVSGGGRVVTRQDIIDKLWGEGVFLETDQGINNAIRKIRLALRDAPERSRFVETVVGKGYRFIAPVMYDAQGEHAGQSDDLRSDAPQAPAPPTLPKLVAKTRKSPPLSVRLGVTMLLALVGGGVTTNVAGSRNWLVNLFRPPVPHIDSLVVLPLENLSREPEQDYFASGMTDALITNLAKMRIKRVISRTSAMHYRGTQKSLKEIARELGVDAVVEGTVQRSGDRVRITAQLIEASTDMHLWADTYERDLHDVLRLQSQVAADIARQINTVLTPQVQAYPVDARAYEAYLKGCYLLNDYSGDAWEKAIRNFDDAILADASFAAAYEGIAESYLVGGIHGAFPDQEARLKGKAAAQNALRLDPNMAAAHISLGFADTWFDWDPLAAEKEYRRGLELNPGYALGHQWYGLHLAVMGRAQEGLEEQVRARDLDPLSITINSNLAASLYRAHHYDEAITQARETLKIDHSFGMPHKWMEKAYRHKGMLRESVAELEAFYGPDEAPGIERAFKTSGYRGVLLHVGEFLERFDDDAEAAWFYAQAGEKNEAFRLLENCYRKRCTHTVLLKADPDFEPLASDTRYKDLLNRLGLRAR